MIQDLHVRGLAIACHLLPHSRWCSRRCGDKGRQLWHARRPRSFVGACHFEKIRGRKQPEKLRGPEALFFKSSLDLSAVYLRRSCLEYAKVSQRGTPGLGVQIADVRLWTETSKRVSINKREKVKKRVKETRRKKSKEAKKNPQWKSSACLFWFAVASVKGTFSHRWGVRTRFGLAEHAKDPGIPNSFPYKDQILAEVAEERRLVCGISRCTACLVLTGYAGGIRLQRRSRSARMRRGRPRRRPQKMARTRMRSCLTA